MKIIVGTIVLDDTFTSRVALQFENGFTLASYFSSNRTLAWMGKEETQKHIDEFNEVLDELESCGFEVEGREKLDAVVSG